MTENTAHKPASLLRPAILIAIFFSAGFLVYSNSFHAEMVFDDYSFIIGELSIRMTELSMETVKTAATESLSAHRYLPNISWAFNYYFGKLDPFGYHLVNLVIHLLNGLFLFFLIQTMLRVYPGGTRDTDPETIAFFTALIWIVQPVGTQAVTYICQRMASMVAFFYILSLFFYIKARMSMRHNPEKRVIMALYFLGCFLSAVCAAATKENAGTLPIILLLYEWFFFQDLRLQWSRNQILWGLLFILVFGCTVIWYLGVNPLNLILESYTPRNFTLIERLMTEWRIMVYYISLFLWAPPGRLNLDHDYPLSFSLTNPPTTLICLITIIGLICFSAYTAKKDRLLAFCFLWFFITQATESTIIGIELIFEHRTYIPFMMTSLTFVIIIFRIIKNKRLSFALLCALALLFSTWTHQRNRIWQDPILFWTDALSKSTDKSRLYNNLAFAYQQKGEWAAAIRNYKKALRMDTAIKTPDFATYTNLGSALIKQNRFFEAAYYYSKALEQKNAPADILLPLASALAGIGELETAKDYYLTVLKIHPENEEAKKGLASLTAFLGQYPDPEAQIRQLLTARPDDPALLLKQGDLYDRQGLSEYAITAYQKADGLTRDDDEMLRRAIMSRLARLFALTFQYEKAITTYKRLIDITPDNALLYYNAAAVCAVAGRFEETRSFLKKAEEKGLNVKEKIQDDPNFEHIR